MKMENKNKLIFNIGFDRNNGGDCLTKDEILNELDKYDFIIKSFEIAQSNTEKTAIIRTLTNLNKLDLFNALFNISKNLDQDCIAVYNEKNNAGRLIGPNFIKWGSFKDEYFLKPKKMLKIGKLLIMHKNSNLLFYSKLFNINFFNVSNYRDISKILISNDFAEYINFINDELDKHERNILKSVIVANDKPKRINKI